MKKDASRAQSLGDHTLEVSRDNHGCPFYGGGRIALVLLEAMDLVWNCPSNLTAGVRSMHLSVFSLFGAVNMNKDVLSFPFLCRSYLMNKQ